MLKDFDNSFTNKVKGWFSNTIYANTAIIYNVAYNLVDDPTTELRFPLISIYRPTGFSLAQNQSFAARRQGIEYYYNQDDNKSSLARFITASLPYQIDIYTKSPEDLDDITENVMQALNFEPTLTVRQKDDETGETYEERYDIMYNNGPVEQSEFQNGDRIYHYSVVYEIPNARLVNFKTRKSVDTVDVSVEADDEEI